MVNLICVLLMDMIEKVNFGYFGLLMGVVLMVFLFWKNYLKFNLEYLIWFNCDCFVLLVGYGLVMFYSLLYLFGYDLLMSELKNFC